MSNIYPEDGSQAPGMHPEPETQTGAAPLKEQVGQVRERVRGEAAHFAETTRQRAVGAVEQGQQQATTAIRDFADAVRTAGDQLGERNQTMVAQVVRQAADGLEGFTRSLEGKRPADMLNAVRDFGRRNPAAFIGGSLLIGLAIGRFIRSSMPDDDYDASGFTSEWEGETMVRGDMGSSGADASTDDLDANSQAFDAEEADMTMTPQGAGAAPRDSGLHSDLEDELNTGATVSDGSATRGV